MDNSTMNITPDSHTGLLDSQIERLSAEPFPSTPDSASVTSSAVSTSASTPPSASELPRLSCDLPRLSANFVRICTCLTLTLLLFSHLLANVMIAVTACLGALVFGYAWRQKKYTSWVEMTLRQLAAQKHHLYLLVALLILMLISVTYTVAPLHEGLSYTTKYTKLLYLLPIMPFFMDVKWRERLINWFIASVTIAILISYLNIHHYIQLDFMRDYPHIFPNIGAYGLFVDLIDVSVMTAFALYLVSYRFISTLQYYWRKSCRDDRAMGCLSGGRTAWAAWGKGTLGCLSLILLFSAHLIFVNGERTGILISGLLFLLLLGQRFSKTAIKIALPLLFISGVLLVHGSSRLHDKFYELFEGKNATFLKTKVGLLFHPSHPDSSRADPNHPDLSQPNPSQTPLNESTTFHQTQPVSASTSASPTVVSASSSVSAPPTLSPTQPISSPTQAVSLTSTQYRLAFDIYSLKMITNHPWFGSGMGSFRHNYQRLKGPNLPGSHVLFEPHNEFLFIGVQVGLVGLMVFVLWLIALYRQGHRFKTPPSLGREPLFRMIEPYHGLNALLLTLIINSLVNATLMGNTGGLFYILFLGVWLAATPPRRPFHKNKSPSGAQIHPSDAETS